MDNGAHFYKCDFQVHTPRDLNWQGNSATTDAQRGQYAQEFVASCRQKGLQAVAITDHHDLAFFKYIREAAENETDEHGKAVSERERLTVFPGMELTLAVPCQALLILDADFPADLLPQVVQALSIVAAPDSDDKHAPTNRLEHIKTLEELHEELEKREFLRGRYIVLPHVGESGNFSLLRKGFAAQYKSMPCVGGFLDGSINQLGVGNSNIVNGKAKEWGNKAIAVLQTSDSRSRDFGKLGTYVTWIKWALPTAEALRQAFLARHSRVSHSEPKLPAIEITRLEVSNSKFLGPINLDLNAQYNALIGGRGTGKSTILEYIRWALCDQPASSDYDELADFQRRRQGLIENTLIPLNATADVFFLVDKVPHVVRRKASGEIQLKIGDNPFQGCTEENVRELLPIRAYSQKQLSAVGARLDELRRFVHSPIQTALSTIEERIGRLRMELQSVFGRVQRYRALQAEMNAHQLERQSLTERIETLRGSLAGLSDEDRSIIREQGTYESEERVVQALERDARAAKEAIESASAELTRLPTTTAQSLAPENAEIINNMRGALEEWLAKTREKLRDQIDAFEEPVDEKALGPFFKNDREWRQRREAHRIKYEESKSRAAAHEATLTQIQLLESRLSELTTAADTKVQEIQRLGNPEPEFVKLRADWKAIHGERADLLEQQCQRLTSISNTRIRASLRRAADREPLEEHLKQIAKGTKTRTDKIEFLTQQIVSAQDPLGAWENVLDELSVLAWMHIEDDAIAVLPALPRLDAAGFTQKEKVAFARKLDPSTWLDLLLFDLKDLPIFEYKIRENDFLPFQDASPGQQATALLSILLLQDGPPLIIDQPEDDLNMKIINEIVETLWDAKTHRQVIFASHNANLVVNGDAELVVCCDYRTSGTESGGKIKLTGAIDMPEVRRDITEVMEGGVEAFQLRRQKYGF